jgi:hypothetical protein
VLTRLGADVDVCHIFPYSVGKVAGDGELKFTFWQILEDFWSEQRVQAWRDIILGPYGTEQLGNLITMSPTCHRWWNSARFALRPISYNEEGHILNIEFWWLADYDRKMRKDKLPLSTRPEDVALDGLEVNRGPGPVLLYHVEKQRLLRSGDIITLRTSDPENLPLPSIELLEMQWILTRLLALAGGAELEDSIYNENDYDELQDIPD